MRGPSVRTVVSHPSGMAARIGGGMMFSRDDLIEIRERAFDWSLAPDLTPGWRRAILELGDAADRLEAMMARSAVPVTVYGADATSLPGNVIPLKRRTK